MSDIGVIDSEMMAALKVLRGDNSNNNKNVNGIDKEFSTSLAEQIVGALQAQDKESGIQNAAILQAIKEQNAILMNLTTLLSKKQKTTIVVVNKEPVAGSSSVASTAAMTEVTEDAEVIAAVAAAEQVTATPDPTPTETTVVKKVAPPAPPAPPPQKRVIQGPWGFVETDVALKRRNRIVKSSGSFKFLPTNIKAEDIPKDAFSPMTNDDVLKKEDALFGKVSKSEDDIGTELKGDSFGQYWDRMRNQVDQYGKLKPPKWSTLGKTCVRSYLPQLSIGGKTQIKLNSGIYYLSMKYENPQATDTAAADDSKAIEAAIIIGEIAFDCRGNVLAPGADWAKLFAGERQLDAPSAAGKSGKKLKWYSSKVSEPWKNGDTLKFKIDTHEDTVGFTITGPNDKEARTGWMFTNVLSFTNNRTYPDYLKVFAYCGGNSSSLLSSSSSSKSSFDSVKFNILDTRRSTMSVTTLTSISSISEEEDKEEEELEEPTATATTTTTPPDAVDADADAVDATTAEV